MITKLALSDHGFQFLKENQILSYLHDQLQKADGLNSLLMPGILLIFFCDEFRFYSEASLY